MSIFGMPVAWYSTRQKCVSTSTLQSEYISFAKAAKTTIWLRMVLQDMTRLSISSIPAFTDNMAAIQSLVDPVARSERLRHLDVAYKFVRELIARGEIKPTYIPTSKMIADQLTKPMRRVQLEQALIQLHLRRISHDMTTVINHT